MALLTGATSEVGRLIAAHLRSSGVELRLTSRDDCSLGHGAETDELVAGVETVVHVEPALVSNNEETDDWLDSCTRCTFNLLVAAEAAGVRHFVLLSRMEVLINLSPEIAIVSPSWRPRPSVSPGSLGPHLAEFTARQFAFSTGQAGGAYEPTSPMVGPKMRVTIVRVGDLAQQVQGSRFWSTHEAIAATVTKTVMDKSSSQYSVAHCGELNLAWTHRGATLKTNRTGVTAKTNSAAPKVVILGANGMMGPPVAWAMAQAGSELLLTDLEPDSQKRDKAQLARDKEFGAGTAHQREVFALPAHAVVKSMHVDVSNAREVDTAVAQADVVIMCAVVREHRELGFRVNTQGTFNAIRAAVANGHDRFINSGPVDAVVGRGMTQGYFGAAAGMNEPSGSTPPWPGVGLYSITKGLGAEICRIFSENYDIAHMMCALCTPRLACTAPVTSCMFHCWSAL